MNIDEYSYIWTTEKDDYVLVDSEHGYAVINKRDQSMLLIEDDELASEIENKMLSEGCKTYKNIKDAFADV